MLDIIGEGLTYDDVMLIPRMNKQGSRFGSLIDISTQLTKQISLKIPILSANMDTITEYQMANMMSSMGGLGIVHRFMDVDTQMQHLSHLTGTRIACIGVSQVSRARLETLMTRSNARPVAVLIDIAHGHCTEMVEQIQWCKETYPQLDVLAGNIATARAAHDLIDAGADCLKVGVGPGSLCTTRINTGNGVPQLTALMEVLSAVERHRPVTIIADGGIRHSGDMIKALAVGADAVMVGGLFAGTTETPGETFTELDGAKYKIYRGMASRDAQRSWKGNVTSVEGESMRVREKGSAQNVVNDLVNNLRSGMTYQNAISLSELELHATFYKQTAAGAMEARAHGLL